MLRIKFSKTFKRSYKKISDDDKAVFIRVLHKLCNGEPLEAKYKDHALKGKYANYKECHLKPDLLLIYKILENELVLQCINIGSHSKLNLD